MRKPSAYIDFEETQPPTDIEDLLCCCHCSVRIEILLCLAAGPLAVGTICDILMFHKAHVSNHLRLLRGGKLVVAEPKKKERLYRLGPSVRVERQANETLLTARADDGAELSIRLPDSATVQRTFSPGLRTRLQAAFGRSAASCRVGEALVRRDGDETRPHPSTGLGSPAGHPAVRQSN
jgi:DNA-binding transcriptional ArsR family regulator